LRSKEDVKMKNRTFLTGLAVLVLSFFVLAGVGWADRGDRYKGRHGYYKSDRHYGTWDRGSRWDSNRWDRGGRWDHDRNWNHKRYDKRDRGRYKSYLDKDYRHRDRYFDNRYDRKFKVRPYYGKNRGKFYHDGHWHAKPYYHGSRSHSSFSFGTSFFDPGFFFGFSIRDGR
jgi:hypothetical protein